MEGRIEKEEFPTHRLVRRLKEIKEQNPTSLNVFLLRDSINEILDELIRYHELKS